MAYDPFAPRAPGERRYWLVKTEPTTFSFDNLIAAPKKTTTWDGVRNPIARNYLRDGMKVGDRAFFYHTGDEKSIVGICEVVREGYPDSTALDKKHAHFDANSKAAAPTWFMVDIKAVGAVPRAVPLSEIKKRSELAYMPLVRIGRLSVSPVTPAEWQIICDMGGVPATLAK
ncbi:MAG: EVE domain-containing protein [Gemmatimonadaceae bacterium]